VIKDYKILPYCQDHKCVGEGDIGPNTGGMGAYSSTQESYLLNRMYGTEGSHSQSSLEGL
jgi:phosphoribosylamine-glycine ligase